MKIIIEGIEMREAIIEAVASTLAHKGLFIKDSIIDVDYDVDGNSWVVHLENKKDE